MNTLFYNDQSSPDTIQILVVTAFADVDINTEIVKKIDGVALKTKHGLLKGSNTISKYIANGHKIAG